MIICTNFLCWKNNFKRSKTIKLCEMFSRVWKPNETPALVFEIVFEKNLSRRNKQLKARRLQQNGTYKLLTKSLDRKKKSGHPAFVTGWTVNWIAIDEVDSYWRGFWETEAKENLHADLIKEVKDSMGQTGGGDHTKRWSLGRWGYKSNWDCPALTEPIQFKRGIYTKETPFSLYSFIMSWKLRTMYTSTSCLSQ